MLKYLLTVCIAVLPFTVNASLVMDFTGGQGGTDNRDYTLGWSFSVNTAITVDGLGLWVYQELSAGNGEDMGTLIRHRFWPEISPSFPHLDECHL